MLKSILVDVVKVIKVILHYLHILEINIIKLFPKELQNKHKIQVKEGDLKNP